MFTAIIRSTRPSAPGVGRDVYLGPRHAECGDPAGPDQREPGRQGGAAASAPAAGNGLDAVQGRAVAPQRGTRPVAVWTTTDTALVLDLIQGTDPPACMTRYVQLVRFSFLILIGRSVTLEL